MAPGAAIVVPLVILVAVVMRGLCERIPTGFSSPWRLRLFLASVALSLAIGRILERCGVFSMIDATNALLRVAAHANEKRRKGIAEDATFDGVRVRLYRPSGKDNPEAEGYPGLVFYHGGGWAIGNTKVYDDVILPIAHVLDLFVVSVEYRLAPRYKFPIPLTDCLRATKYFMNHAADFGIDPERIAVGGDSAGGNLAAAVILKLRDEHFRPMPKLQILIYPVLQSLDFALPSMIQNGSGPLLTTFWLAYYTSLYATGSLKYVSAIRQNRHVAADARRQMYDTYLDHRFLDQKYRHYPYRKADLAGGDQKTWQELSGVLLNPYFSPLLAKDLSDLPETFIYGAYYDVLRDEGLLYAKRLQSAGVPVTHVIGENALHGICSFRHLFPKESYQALNSIANFLKAKL